MEVAFAVALGGAVGAILRWLVAVLVSHISAPAFWGTLAVNLAGSFLIGLLLIWFQEKFPIIGDVRGSGFFIGVELVKIRDSMEPAPKHASYVAERMKERGILISTDGIRHNVQKIRPPMVFTQNNAELLVSIMNDVLQESFFQ